MRLATLLVAVILHSPIISAKLSLAHVFTDHTVIQANRPIKVWGHAAPGQKIMVQLGNETRTTNAADSGEWVTEFPQIQASYEPFNLTVTSAGEKLACKNMVAGEVWLATGQSNMQWALNQSTGGKKESQSCHDPHLRFLHHQGTLHPGNKKYPRDFLTELSHENYYRCEGWKTCTPENAAGFSAVAYYFAKMLRKKLDVPIGIIALPVGGSPIESHLPKRAFHLDPQLRSLLREWWNNSDYPQWCRLRAAHNLSHWLAAPEEGKDPPHPFAPTFLWRAGIEPLKQFPIRGVIWYQGESNATIDGGAGKATSKALNYNKLRALLDSLRIHWQDGTLPFYHVQLPGLNRDWAPFREMQQELTDNTKATGLAITLDVGHPTNVHPPNKKPVGERLARLALSQTYKIDIAHKGPRPNKFSFNGSTLILDYANPNGLKTTDRLAPTSFELSGVNGEFFPAKAIIKDSQIILSSDKVRKPLYVRYAWAKNPHVNLINDAGLPAHPFLKTLIK